MCQKSPLQSFYFKQKSALSSIRVFQENSLIVACYTFDRLEIRILTPNRLKIKSVTHSNYLATIATINKDFLNKIVAFHIALLL